MEVDTSSLRAAADVMRSASDGLPGPAARVSTAETGHDGLDEAVHQLVETVKRAGRGLADELDVTVWALRFAAARYEATEGSVVR